MNNSKEIGEILITKGADINAHDLMINNFSNVFWNQLRKLKNKNFTPLHIAAGCNSIAMGELLILKGADIDAISIIDQNIILSFFIMIIQNR